MTAFIFPEMNAVKFPRNIKMDIVSGSRLFRQKDCKGKRVSPGTLQASAAGGGGPRRSVPPSSQVSHLNLLLAMRVPDSAAIALFIHLWLQGLGVHPACRPCLQPACSEQHLILHTQPRGLQPEPSPEPCSQPHPPPQCWAQDHSVLVALHACPPRGS